MASSISAEMAAYCAARSTSGTDGVFDSTIPTSSMPVLTYRRQQLDGRPSALERAVNGFHDPYHVSALWPSGERAAALRHALQEVAALILERLAYLDPGTDDVAVAQAELVLAVAGGHLHHRCDALLVDPHRLHRVQVVEGDPLVAADDDDFPHLVRIGPAHVDVADHIARIAK